MEMEGTAVAGRTEAAEEVRMGDTAHMPLAAVVGSSQEMEAAEDIPVEHNLAEVAGASLMRKGEVAAAVAHIATREGLGLVVVDNE